MIEKQKVIEMVNQIQDNLWLGDLQKAKEIIVTLLRTEESYYKFQESFEEVCSLFEKAQKIAKEKYKKYRGFDYKLLLSKEFKRQIEVPSKFQEAIVGLLLSDSKKLLRKLEGIKPLYEIIHKPSYKYTIFEYPPKYEIRALIEGGLKCNVDGLIEKLKERRFEILRIDVKYYAYIVAFSQQSYVEISALPPKVNISISLLTPSREKAQELGEMIMNFLLG